MSDPNDDFDPNEVFKGWAERSRPAAPPVAPASPVDFSDVLDAVARQATQDDPTRLSDAWSAVFAPPTQARARHDEDDIVDVTPIDARPRSIFGDLDEAELVSVGTAAAEVARAKAREPVADVDDVVFTEAPVAVRRSTNPRVLAAWRPGAWTVAQRRVLEASTEVVQTLQGPVVETHPPQHLVALWPPQGLDVPVLGRWPQRAMLVPAESERAAEAALPWVPDEAEIWVAPVDIDWGLVGNVVLHHDATLQPFQLTGLRAFVEAERLATYDRVNDAYSVPEPGHPPTRRAGA